MPQEIDQLREEVAALRRDLNHVLRILNQDEEPGHPRPEFMSLDAEIIGVRTSLHSYPILLKAHPEGYACAYFHDSQMRTRGLFRVDDDGASFEIWNKDRQVVVSIGEASDGSGQVFVASPDGKPRAGLQVTEFGGTVCVQNEAGATQGAMIATSDGGKIIVSDTGMRGGVTILADTKGGTVLAKEPTGQVMAYVHGQNERGVVSVFNAQGDQAACLSSDDNGGAVLFYDNDGKVRSSLP
jgi:hypothetical protein